MAGLKKEVQALIAEGIALVWESYKLDPYVQRLAETVFNFQEKVCCECDLPFPGREPGTGTANSPVSGRGR